jgi:prolyl-tRNA synthetase
MSIPKIKHALPVTRAADFAAWYQAVISEADLAEESGVRGCMVIRPWGYGIWERIQKLMDARIKAAGVENCYFPLFIPLSFFAEEADHVEGFAKEMAVVTHHRLRSIDGKLQPDPDSKLEEPLVVRPTSETVIGKAMSRWIQSWRDLPLLVNQWANVVRWEMRTRMFLRTSEFLWQEGHTAHADEADARLETMRALEMYRDFAETELAMPVVAGEKPENERFPGAVATFSIEAMMQDGKALQAGTSHYLGTGFAQAANIRYQDADGQQALCHTTSWGVSTRMIGGVIMVHGDDDGLRCPPMIAPHQVVIVPMLRDTPEDEAVLAYCTDLAKALGEIDVFREPLRVLLDKKPIKAATKRWSWVKKGAPVIVEVGGRDVAGDNVSVLRRDRLYTDAGKTASMIMAQADFRVGIANMLRDIQASLYEDAKIRLDANIRDGATELADLAVAFAGDKPGWVLVEWSKPSGDALAKVVDWLKGEKLTLRNAPLEQAAASGTCIFTGAAAVERVLVGRAY